MAQQPNQWVPPQRILGYDDDVQTLYLVADQNRTVHAFASQAIDEYDENSEVGIVYRQWTLEQGWTLPTDILLAPINRHAWVLGAFLDRTGFMHIIFFGYAGRDGNIYYTQAPVASADQAPSWSIPVVVGEQAITSREAALVADDQGNLLILYSGNQNGHGLYAVHSTDGGSTWSDPLPIFLTYTRQIWPFALKMYPDQQDGGVHVVWSVANINYSEAIYYTHIRIDPLEWSEPLELAQAIEFEADTPAVIKTDDGELFVIYHNDFPTTRWMIRSSDNGQTWTDPVRPFPDHAGGNGSASLVLDSRNMLHMFFGNQVWKDSGALHGMWHSVWQGDRWSVPEAIVSGPRVMRRPGGRGFDPSSANAVVSQGNVILLTWRTEPGAGPNGIWYSHITLDAPELPVVPLPTSPARPAATPTPTARPTLLIQTPAPTRPVLADRQADESSTTANTFGTPLTFGLISTILLISAIIVVYRLYLYIRY